MSVTAFYRFVDLLCMRGFAVLLQSTLLICCGLLIGAAVHRFGPRFQCFVYRLTLAAVIFSMVSTLAVGGFNVSLWKVSAPDRTSVNEDILNLVFPPRAKAAAIPPVIQANNILPTATIT
ncbi:MAG: hypothetical protein ABJA67_12390, partial [Chthonomonadales bacterium]